MLRYLKGNSLYGIWYTNIGDFRLCGFSDSDWAGSINDCRSTAGYTFNLSSCAIYWCSKRQPFIALPSSEAKYIAITSAVCQATWLRRILEEWSNIKKRQPLFTVIITPQLQ